MLQLVFDCKLKMSGSKQSDFSIDHILNRAGETCKSVEQCNLCLNGNLIQASGIVPHFDWLQYTRYHPPKISRPNRNTPVKRKAGRLPRIPFTPQQLETLEESYRISTYLSSDDASRLAQILNLTSTRVKIWFQNRRARERRETKMNSSAESSSSCIINCESD